jgi:hypothetical protein
MKTTYSKSWVADQGLTAWVEKDSRSAAAMLRGRGDGREKLYARFAEYRRGIDPALPEDEIMDGYASYTRKMERQAAQEVIDNAARIRNKTLRRRPSSARLITGSTVHQLWALAQRYTGPLVILICFTKALADFLQ